MNLLSLLFLFYASAGTAQAIESPREKLAQSQARFNKGDYAQALKLLENIEIRAHFDSGEDMLKAFKIKAIAYGELGHKEKAAETIRELLFMDPAYQFDLFDTPAATVALAEIERKKIEEKNAELASAKNELALPPPPELPKPALENFVLEKKIIVEKKPPLLVGLAPFGLNHLILDKPIKGTLYALAQAFGLVANVGSFWFKQRSLTDWGSHVLKDPSDSVFFDRLQSVQYIGLGTLALGYALSVIDALITITKTDTESITTEE